MLKFIGIRSNEKNIKLLFNWRRKDFIQNNSLTKITNNYNKHKNWFLKSIDKIDYHHWFITFKNRKIGWICITEPDFNKNHIRWGYYIGEKKYTYLGAIIPCYLYNFIFTELKFNFILAETLEQNKMVSQILKLHNFKKTSCIKTQFKSNNKFIMRTNYQLSKKNWFKNSNFNQYKDFFFLPKKKLLYLSYEK